MCLKSSKVPFPLAKKTLKNNNSQTKKTIHKKTHWKELNCLLSWEHVGAELYQLIL